MRGERGILREGRDEGGEKNKAGPSELDIRFVSVLDRLQIIFVLKSLSLSYKSLYESALKLTDLHVDYEVYCLI